MTKFGFLSFGLFAVACASPDGSDRGPKTHEESTYVAVCEYRCPADRGGELIARYVELGVDDVAAEEAATERMTAHLRELGADDACESVAELYRARCLPEVDPFDTFAFSPECLSWPVQYTDDRPSELPWTCEPPRMEESP
ncbi:MAG: hypothetical protein MUE69_23065 [Myxococcota bacterium]|jgi:hypothetical protein|nr:hypothetical protein [Myxococcota bacterium]